MSVQENKANVRRIYDDLWNEHKLKVADEVIAAEGYINYDTGLSPVPADPKDIKQTFRMVTAGFPDNRHEVEDVISEGDRVVARVTLTGTHEGERSRAGRARSRREASCSTNERRRKR
jgi:predicted ester cyclase